MVLINVARLSLSAVAALRGGFSRETLRKAILALLPDVPETLRRVGRLLRGTLPRSLRRPGRQRRRYPLAVDLHSVPYYKRHQEPPKRVRKGRPKPGTAYSHQYATATLLRKGRYFTVGVTLYLPGESLAETLRRLLRQVAAQGFTPRYVLLDRSFWAVDVFAYLQRARYPFLLPLQASGKKPTAENAATGTYRFLYDCPSGWYVYRLVNCRGRVARVQIGVQRHNYAGRQGKQGRFTWAYAGWRIPVGRVLWLHQCHRRRFRVESSYRLLEAARGRTSSREEKLRLWYVLVALVLLNLWLELRRKDSRNSRVLHRWWNRVLTAIIFFALQECSGNTPNNLAAEVPANE
jgi:hypothetical protein